MREARWAIAEAKGASDAVVGMVGAVPLGGIGILCHLAVHRDYHKLGLGTVLSSWAVSYLRSQGTRVVRLDSTRQAESLYRSLGFKPTSRRAAYRLEGAALKAQTCVARLQSTREVGLRVTPLVFEDLPELYGVDRWSFGETARS
jgi:ribosomal protein S18 acetylase RimI-like enzyme